MNVTIVPLAKYLAMPYSPVNIPKDEFEQITGHKARKEENVLLTFPINANDPVDKLFYRAYAVAGTVKNEGINGVVYIETFNRCYIDYNDCECDDSYDFAVSECYEDADISDDELKNCKTRIIAALSNTDGVNPEWLRVMTALLNSAERPEIILSISPLNFIDYEQCYAILAEDSLKKRTEMTEKYITESIASGKLKKALDIMQITK